MKDKKILIPLAIIAVLIVMLIVVMCIDDKENAPSGVADSAATTSPSEPSSDASLPQYSGKVLEFDPNTVTEIDVVLSPDESYSLVKSGDAWIANGNANISISSSSVDLLAVYLSSIYYVDVVSDGSISAEDCGIKDTGMYITFTGELGVTTVKKGIDMTTPEGSFSYIMINDNPEVYFADIESVYKLFRHLSTYRHKASVNVDFDTLNYIEIKSDTSMTLEKGSIDRNKGVNYEWRITSPIQICARDDQVNSLIINPLKNMSITDFASDTGDFASCGLADKDRYITLKDAGGRVSTVYFSKEIDGRYYISVDNNTTIFEVSFDNAPYVALGFADVFDRSVHLTKMAGISSVTVSGGGYDYNVEFTRTDGKVNGKTVSSDDMNYKVFPAVCGLYADDLYFGENTGNAEVTMIFKYTDGKSDTITFSSLDERTYVVSKNGVPKFSMLKYKLSDMATALDNV